jgi:acyl dehydratase
MYFEEFMPSLTIITGIHQVTMQEIDNFTTLSGDNNPIHVDEQYASNTAYGKRIAHGLLVAAIVSGLAVQTGLAKHLVVSREIRWRFLGPVFIGDEIHAEISVKEMKPIPRLGNGLVTFVMRVYKQTGELVSSGQWEAIIRSR